MDSLHPTACVAPDRSTLGDYSFLIDESLGVLSARMESGCERLHSIASRRTAE